MTIGAMVIDNGLVGDTAYGHSRTFAIRGKFDQNVILRSLRVYASSAGASSIKPVVYDHATSALVSSETLIDLTSSGTNLPHDIELQNPITLQANKEYLIGYYVGTSGWRPYTKGGGGPITQQSSPAGVTFTMVFNGGYTSTGDVIPSGQVANIIAGGYTVDFTNSLPSSPTGLSATNPIKNGGPANLSWTHNDADGNPQSGYQIRYRRTS